MQGKVRRKTSRTIALVLGITVSTVAVGMVASRPRPLFRIEAQRLIDRELCMGKPCPIEPGSELATDPSDAGIGFATVVVAPRSHIVPTTPYGVPSGVSRYGVIGIASRTTLGWWWKSAVNIGIRPYHSPPNIVLVDDRYSARRIDWVRRNWNRVSKADLFAELSIARYTRDYSEQADQMIAKLMSKSEAGHPISLDSLY